MWLVKQKYSPNFNKLALHGIPKGAGEKGGIPKATRKRNQNKAKTTIVDRMSSDRLDCDKVYNSQGLQFSVSDPIVDQGGACFMPIQNNFCARIISSSITVLSYADVREYRTFCNTQYDAFSYDK